MRVLLRVLLVVAVGAIGFAIASLSWGPVASGPAPPSAAPFAAPATPSAAEPPLPAESTPAPSPAEPASATGVLRGRVLEAGGLEPIVGARVTVAGTGIATVSGAGGEYRLELEPQGFVDLEVFSAEHRPATVTVEAKGEAAKVRDIFLVAGARLAGRVLFEGVPVVGARVRAEEEDRVAITGPDGAYELRGLGPGFHDVRVSAGDLHEQEVLVEVSPATSEVPLDIHLLREWTATGSVVGPDGRPVEGARVAAEPEGLFDPDHGPSTLTAADGSFRLREAADLYRRWMLSSTLPYPGPRLWAWKEGLGLGVSERVEPLRGETTAGIEIRMAAPVDYALEVVDPGGSPLAGCGVSAQMTEYGDVGWYWGVLPVPSLERSTDEGGVVTLPLQPGRWEIRVGREGCFRARTWNEVAAGEAAERPRVVLRPGGFLSGRVVDPGGRPLAGTAVVFHRDRDPPVPATTDAAGRFRIGDLLEGGKTRLHISRRGYLERWVESPAPGAMETDLALQPVPAGAIRGRVLLEDGETPARVATVRAYREEAEEGGPTRVPPRPVATLEVNDADGRFTVHGLDPGRYTVEASRGNLLARASGIEAREQADEGGIEFVLRSGAVLTGWIRDERGSPVPSAFVQLGREGESGVWKSTWSDGRGAYRFEGLPGGGYRISVSGDGKAYRFTEVMATVEPHRENVLPVTVRGP